MQMGHSISRTSWKRARVKEAKKETTPPPAQPKEGTTVPQKEKEPAKNIKIESVTLQGGRIDFLDRSIQPEFSLRLAEMGGRVSGLSSEETAMGDVELRGKLNDFAPLEIVGKINPLKEDLYVDLKVMFKDIDLSPMTPYSGRYVGYTIEKGKLNFDLKYLIVKKKLDSQNHIFFDIEDGRLDLSTRYKYAKGGKGEEIDLLGLAISLSSLRFKKPEENEDFLKIPNFSIKETDLSLSKKEIEGWSLFHTEWRTVC